MAASPGSTYLHLSRRVWIALGAMLIAPWLLLVWVIQHPAVDPVSKPLPKRGPAVPGTTSLTRLHPGPWGDLEYSRIVVEPPSEFIPAAEAQADVVRWVFRGYAESSLQELWQRAGLTPAQRESLNRPEHRKPSGSGIVVQPEPAIVLSLTPAARTVIYTALAEFPENPSQNSPFRLRADVAEDWFDDCGLPPDIVALVRGLLYRRANSVLFSDQDIVLPRLESREMRVQFLKTLSRKSTLLLQLRVHAGMDVEGLVTYWSRGRRSKDVRPLLQSLARRPDGGTLDVVHLLPPFPRSLLYTYPSPSGKSSDTAHDCHWTAFNFFRDEPDERFADIEYVKQTLLGSYYPVPGDSVMGDVLVLVQPNGVVVHSCVYIADDIVFTKNGSAFSIPWQLGSLDQVVAFYSFGAPLEVRRFRLKDR